MNRMLFVFTLVATMLVPGSALSASDTAKESYSASVTKRGFSINFTVFRQNGKPKRVGNFSYSGVEMTCETGGPFTASGSGFGTAQDGPNRAAKVEDKEFSKRYPAVTNGGGQGSFKVTGEFRNHNTKVRGTIRVKGDYPNVPATGCDSGTLNYVAE